MWATAFPGTNTQKTPHASLGESTIDRSLACPTAITTAARQPSRDAHLSPAEPLHLLTKAHGNHRRARSGSVNLIGDHAGWCLPMAIDRWTEIAAMPNPARPVVRLASDAQSEHAVVPIDAACPRHRRGRVMSPR